MTSRLKILRTVAALRRATQPYRKTGARIALVPTMGALHRGHLALVRQARRRADKVVVSIFVNPTQFAPNEDFASYPRDFAADIAALKAEKVELVWAPTVAAMYPAGFATRIEPQGAAKAGLEDKFRPHFFGGVATVVAKLFMQVAPDMALFGEKDFQQLAVIRRMAADLDMGIEIVGVPTEREEDGLALSSRNVYLSPEERVQARALPRALGAAQAGIEAGGDVDETLAKAAAALVEAGFEQPDYVTLCDAATLQPIAALTDRPARLLAAARLGRARLIDNVPVAARK